jgi:hypothetical protein
MLLAPGAGASNRIKVGALNPDGAILCRKVLGATMSSFASSKSRAGEWKSTGTYLDDIFASVYTNRIETFHEEGSFSDPFGTTTFCVTNSDFRLDGPESMAKKQWASKLDYSSGIVVMRTLRHSAKKYNDFYENRREYYHTSVMPLADFNKIFADPPKFSQRLQAEGAQLIEEWNRENAAPERVGKRTPNEKRYRLSTYEWRGENNVKHRSHLELQLNTFGFTVENGQYPQVAKMKLRDIKVG